MEIDLNRYVEVEFGLGKVIVAKTEPLPGTIETRFGVIVSASATDKTGEQGSDASAEPTPTGGLLLTFPTKEQAVRVHAALMNL